MDYRSPLCPCLEEADGEDQKALAVHIWNARSGRCRDD
jgi:hypothetical protein